MREQVAGLLEWADACIFQVHAGSSRPCPQGMHLFGSLIALSLYLYLYLSLARSLSPSLSLLLHALQTLVLLAALQRCRLCDAQCRCVFHTGHGDVIRHKFNQTPDLRSPKARVPEAHQQLPVLLACHCTFNRHLFGPLRVSFLLRPFPTPPFPLPLPDS